MAAKRSDAAPLVSPEATLLWKCSVSRDSGYQELIGTELALEGRWNEWIQHLPFLYPKNDRGSYGEKGYSPGRSRSSRAFLDHGGVRTPWTWSWYE